MYAPGTPVYVHSLGVRGEVVEQIAPREQSSDYWVEVTLHPEQDPELMALSDEDLSLSEID